MITITKNLFVSLGFPELDDLLIDTGDVNLNCDDIQLPDFDCKPQTGKLFLMRDGKLIGALKPKMITWIDRLTNEKIKSKTIPKGWLQ